MTASVVLLLLSGCSQLQTLRVIDAQSGEPLGEIHGERLQASLHASEIPLVMLDTLTPVESQQTDGSGSLRFKESGSRFMVNPDWKNGMYGEAYVTTTWSGAKICYPDEHREITVSRKNGVIEVPLHSRTAAKSTAKYLPQ